MMYYMPTKVIHEKNCIKKNGCLLKALGNKALIVTGRNSAKNNGSQEDVETALTANGQEFAVFDRIRSNPTLESVYEGAEEAKRFGADFVIGIGGGSPMDAAKAIALLAVQDISKDAFFGAEIKKALPMAMVPTTAGTGSEVTQYSIITNDRKRTKTSISSPVLFPRLALLDGAYMDGLSKENTVNTAIDALSHLMEGYLSPRAGQATDALAQRGMKMIAKEFDNLASFTLDSAARDTLLMASALGGMVIANTGTTAVHAMGYGLTYFKDVDHGRANGLLITSFLKFIYDQCRERVDEMMQAMSFSGLAEFGQAIDRLLGEKEKVTPEELEVYTDIAKDSKNLRNCIAAVTRDDILNIYLASFGYRG